MKDYSKEMFNFKELTVEKIENKEGGKYVYVKSDVTTQICPNCGNLATKSKGYGKTRYIKDIDIAGYNGMIVYTPKRLRCECGKTFTVNIQELPKRGNITTRKKEKILADLTQKVNIKEIARNNNVSEKTVIKLLDKISYKTDEIGEIVCIDDFKGNLDGIKYQTGMYNPQTRKVTNIYKSRRKDDLIAEIQKIPREKREKVKFYICDMNETYIDIGRLLFRNAEIVIDKFHYTQVVTMAVDKIRKRIQKDLSDDERKYFKHTRFALLKRRENLKKTERINQYEQLDRMLNVSKDLEKAYILEQKFYEINNCKDKKNAREQMKTYMNMCEKSEIKEFKDVSKTLFYHMDYILNAFDTKYTNGFAEGKNNSIKVMKRQGYGYKNRERFLKRIMHIENNR